MMMITCTYLYITYMYAAGKTLIADYWAWACRPAGIVLASAASVALFNVGQAANAKIKARSNYAEAGLDTDSAIKSRAGIRITIYSISGIATMTCTHYGYEYS